MQPYLMQHIEGLIQDSLQIQNIDILNESAEKLFDFDNFSDLIYTTFYFENSYDLLESHINKNVLVWIHGLSIRYGSRIFEIKSKRDNPYYWRRVSSRLFFTDEPLQELTITRNDDQVFIISCNRASLIYLIEVLSHRLHEINHTDITESELESIDEIMNDFNKLKNKMME